MILEMKIAVVSVALLHSKNVVVIFVLEAKMLPMVGRDHIKVLDVLKLFWKFICFDQGIGHQLTKPVGSAMIHGDQEQIAFGRSRSLISPPPVESNGVQATIKPPAEQGELIEFLPY